MSVDLVVLARRPIDLRSWREEIVRLGFPLELDASLDLGDADGGFLPARCHGEDTGFFFGVGPVGDYPLPDGLSARTASFAASATFSFSREDELVAASYAAAALATATDGLMYDPQEEGEKAVYGASAAVAYARELPSW